MSETSADPLAHLQWLNAKFFQDILRPQFKDDTLEIVKCDLKKATSDGDNYGSLMVRANLDMKQKDKAENLSIIIKTVLPTPYFVDEDPSRAIFEREASMVAENLPEFHEILTKLDPGNFPKIFPTCYYHQLDPCLILLEDLSVDGFRLAKRKDGLDLEHALLVLESLGRLHASSIPVISKKPELKNYDSFWTPKSSFAVEKLLGFGYRMLVTELETWEESSLYLDRLKKIKPALLEKLYQVHEVSDDKLSVMLHGDLWANNMMFRYKDEKPVAIKLVDFQLSHYGSPAIDLAYFLFGSVNGKIRDDNFDLLLKTYYNSFHAIFQQLDCNLKPYTLNDLRKDFHDAAMQAFLSGTCIFPGTIAPKDNFLEVSKIFSDTDNYTHDGIYKSERYAEEMKRLLNFCAQHDIF